MPRKKSQTETADNAIDAIAPATNEQATKNIPPQPVADEQPLTVVGQESEAGDAQGPSDPNARNWGPPYKAIFVSKAKGFEMGENRRFKQRLFMFAEKPDPQIIEILKENGFTYRPAEKTWTIQADAASRLLSDRLARQFAGQNQEINP